MRIKMRTRARGPEILLDPEKEYELEDKLAITLVEAGYAFPVRAAPKVEHATAPPDSEKAVAEPEPGDVTEEEPKPKRRRRRTTKKA